MAGKATAPAASSLIASSVPLVTDSVPLAPDPPATLTA